MTEQYSINARFVTQPLTGVQRYCYELSLRLRNGILLAPRPPAQDYDGLRQRVVVTGGYLTGHAWEQLTLPWVRRGPLLSPAGCGPIAHRNHVVTIHDVAPLDNPQWFSRSFALWYSQLLPALSKSARKIVTVSGFCKQRIVESLLVPEDSVIVAGEAASEGFFPRTLSEVEECLTRLSIRTPYFLALGGISERKNFTRLMGAWTRVGKDLKGATLVVVAKERLRFSAAATLGTRPEGVLHLASINDSDLACLYSGARGFLYPSLYEGFGLPLLEAMACGCPVVTSNCTAMPEIAGDAAILVNPFLEESIAEGIRLLTQDGRSRELRERGFERYRSFSWLQTARMVESAILN